MADRIARLFMISLLGVAVAMPVAGSAAEAPAIKAYKRDPLPIYDDAGIKVRDVPVASMPAVGSPGAQVIRARTGFAGIQLDGKLVWLRLSTVDYVGDISAIKCDANAMKFAKMEEDGLQQSLGLGCAGSGAK
ncbi:hypothetical protein SAMN05444678_10772 [Sphingomonas sp. YR710]|jgi:hypothetical protein|uniref:hypothetical protein n=1 Tax=Sphingomonas sp. YR710 TaxID=1882773 RepID=UPI000880042E|nr:hypothetical protein [Sphingomonas sp. YR710]SDC94627.1 hypothetical protein SAMN05444678_10772 [Sphingomonas sp. YR710]